MNACAARFSYLPQSLGRFSQSCKNDKGLCLCISTACKLPLLAKLSIRTVVGSVSDSGIVSNNLRCTAFTRWCRISHLQCCPKAHHYVMLVGGDESKASHLGTKIRRLGMPRFSIVLSGPIDAERRELRVLKIFSCQRGVSAGLCIRLHSIAHVAQ